MESSSIFKVYRGADSTKKECFFFPIFLNVTLFSSHEMYAKLGINPSVALQLFKASASSCNKGFGDYSKLWTPNIFMWDLNENIMFI